ncbi:MAG: hypothetical protein Kow0042_07580 [Calditrichia bacterium]
MEIKELLKKHHMGVELIRQRGYLDRLLSEVHLLVRYIDTKYFMRLFSDNFVDDVRGVFIAFVRQDLREIYEEMKRSPDVPLNVYLERDYMNLVILQKCATNLRYQVKSVLHMKKVRELEFKSSFLQLVSRKLNGEIQELYRILSNNYKQYFRMQFSSPANNENAVSLGCIDKLQQNFDESFLTIMNRFYQLSDAIRFVQKLFKYEIESEIRNRMAHLFYENENKLVRIVDHLIHDLKRNFIRTLDRHLRSGQDIERIEKGFVQYIESVKFESFLRRVIFHAFSLMKSQQRPEMTSDIF